MSDQRYLVWKTEPNDHYTSLTLALEKAETAALADEGATYLVREAIIDPVSSVDTADVTTTTRSLLTGLWGYWDCDDASSMVLTDIHGANDMDIFDNVLPVVGNPYTWGTDADAILGTSRTPDDFNQQARVTVPLGTGADLAFSSSGWFKAGGGNNDGILCGVTDGTTQYSLQVNDYSGPDFVDILSTGDPVTKSNAIFGANVYTHYAMTWDGEAIRFYQNAVLLAQKVPTTLIVGSVVFWNGSVEGGVTDEWGFWTRALSTADVTALYNDGAGLAYGSF